MSDNSDIRDKSVTIEQYDELREKYLERERRVYLARLLKNGFSYPKNAIEAGIDCGIVFRGDRFATLCINIDDLYSLFFESDIIYNEENLSTAFFITGNVIQDTVGRICHCMITPTDSWMVFILSIDGADDDLSAERFILRLRELTREAIGFVEKNFGLKLSAIISNIYEGVSGISAAYSKARELRDYKRFLGLDERVMYYNDYYRREASIEEIMNEPRVENNEFTLTLNFMKSVRRGEYIEAKNIMRELIHDRLFATTPAIQTVPHTFYGFNHLFFLAIEEIRAQGDKNIAMILRPGERLSMDLPIRKIQQNMENLFDYLAEYKTRPPANPPPVWLHKLSEYINKNYTDVNINISTAAEHFNINPAYASRMFKKQFGIGIMDCINELRIEKAKSLISAGENVSEAANLVGYGSAITMRRAFKRYEGYTPSNLI